MTRASCILFWFSITLAVSLGLYHTSYRVDRLTHTLSSLNAHIKTEQRNIHILKAEWVYLANPSRIEMAARKYLDLMPTKTNQIASMRNLSNLLPTQREAAVTARHLASQAVTSLRRQHPAASTPKPVAEEAARLNTRLVIGEQTASALPKRIRYRFAGDDSYGIGSVGGSP